MTGLVLLLGDASSFETLLLFMLYKLRMKNLTSKSSDLVGVDCDP